MAKSNIIEKINNLLEASQEKLSFLEKDSFIVRHVDNVILFFISLTLAFSLFMKTDYIVLPAIVVVFLTVVKLFVRVGERFEIQRYGSFLLAYLGIGLLSVLFSHAVGLSFKGFSKIFIYLCYYFSVFQYLKVNRDKIFYFVVLIGALCSFESIYALLQNHAGTIAGATWQDRSYVNPEEVIDRVYGTLQPYNPNLLGAYLLAGIFSVAGACLVWVYEKKYFPAMFSAVLFLCSTAALVLTGCRGAYLGFFAGCAMFIWILGKIVWRDYAADEKLKNVYTAVTTSIVAISTVAVLAVPAVLKRVISIFMFRGDSSTSFRMNVYQSSIKMFFDNWLIGIGPGNLTFREIYGYYMKTGFDALSAYNIYLEVAVESGIFAMIAFCAFFILIIKDGYKLIFQTVNMRQKILVLSAFLSVFAVAVHGFVDTIFFRPQLQFVFWLLVAVLTTSISEMKHTQEAD